MLVSDFHPESFQLYWVIHLIRIFVIQRLRHYVMHGYYTKRYSDASWAGFFTDKAKKTTTTTTTTMTTTTTTTTTTMMIKRQDGNSPKKLFVFWKNSLFCRFTFLAAAAAQQATLDLILVPTHPPYPLQLTPAHPHTAPTIQNRYRQGSFCGSTIEIERLGGSTTAVSMSSTIVSGSENESERDRRLKLVSSNDAAAA